MALFQLEPEESSLNRDNNPLRQKLLQHAENHFLQSGYQGTRINDVISSAGTTKGGFYHHFRSKQDLAYQLIDERVRPVISSRWIDPVASSTSPADAVREVFKDHFTGLTDEEIRYGCVLTQLAQTCASENEGFRLRLESIYQHWISEWTHALEQESPAERKFIEAKVILLVSMVQGTYTLLKVSLSSHVVRQQLESFEGLLEELGN